MYEDSKSSIDWKGLFLKVIIAFLIVLIAVKGYTTLKGKTNTDTTKTTTEVSADTKSSTTFTENMKKLKDAGQTYFDNAKDKLPSKNGATSMVTLNDLITNGNIESLTDEDGKTCDGESSYVTAILDGSEYKLKANLVCGDASSYSLVYLGQNDSSTITNNNNTKASGNTSSNNNESEYTNTCTSDNCSSSVKVNTKTSVSQKVNIGSNNNNNNNNNDTSSNYEPEQYSYTTNNTKYYTVIFDSNGGTKNFASKSIKANNKVSNPGSNYRSGCTFKGWYLNGTKYNFNSIVTSNMTLVANYTCNNNANYYYDDDDEEDYENNYSNRDLTKKTTTTTVYTMGWDNYGTNSFGVTHTLKLPSYLNNSDVEKVRIKSISYVSPINTSTLANAYSRNHSNTFIYSNNGWEATEDYYASNLATINRGNVTFYYGSGYKNLRTARNEGFDVKWHTTRVAEQCEETFSVNGEDNKCDYGIVYKVTWEYEIYE